MNKPYKIGLKISQNRCNKCSEWVVPTIIILKKYDTVYYLSDVIELNKRIKRKLLYILNIRDLLMKMKGSQYVTSKELNLGYYNIELTLNSSKLSTIILPWESMNTFICQ